MEEAGRFLRPMVNDGVYFQFISVAVRRYSVRLIMKGIIVGFTSSG